MTLDFDLLKKMYTKFMYKSDTFVDVHNHPKRMFFIMCPTTKKNNRITKERKHNEAIKTFQRIISVEGVNE